MTTRDTNPFIRLTPDNPFRKDHLEEFIPVDPPAPDLVQLHEGDKAPEWGPWIPSIPDTDPEGPSRVAMQPEDRLDLLLKEAREIKADIKALEERYSDLRLSIWEAAGHKIGKLPGGAAFRKLTSRRSVKYKDLKADHPEIYRKYVTETDPDPDAPGALYL